MTTRKTGANVQCQVEENHINFSKPKFAEMLINKKNVFFYWSTKCWLEILLINKRINMETHQNVDQQNFHLQFCWSTKFWFFNIISCQGGPPPPRERSPNFWEPFWTLNPKVHVTMGVMAVHPSPFDGANAENHTGGSRQFSSKMCFMYCSWALRDEKLQYMLKYDSNISALIEILYLIISWGMILDTSPTLQLGSLAVPALEKKFWPQM